MIAEFLVQLAVYMYYSLVKFSSVATEVQEKRALYYPTALYIYLRTIDEYKLN